MDCLGNPASLKKFSLSLWSTRYLPHMIYVANDLYLQEDFEKILICHKKKSPSPLYYLVITGIESQKRLEELKSYFTKKGFIRTVRFVL